MRFECLVKILSQLITQKSKLYIMNLYIKLVFILLFVMLMVAVVQAQPGLPGPPSQAPIDGGLTLLAAAGGAYAIKKLRDKKKGEEDNYEG